MNASPQNLPDGCQPALHALLPEGFARLRRLVEVNSGTFNAPGVEENARMIAGWFAALGFQARREPSLTPGCGDHLILTRQGAGDRNFVFVGHLDTVYTPEEERDNRFSWREEDDRIYGPGTADIKGGTVLMLTVLETLRAADPGLFERLTWRVLLNATEEISSDTFARLSPEYADAGTLACLVFEAGRECANAPGETSIVMARNAVVRFGVEAFGRAAHSGAAHARGVNAVRELARAVERIELLTREDRELTFNVGLIGGGTAVNCVPAKAWAQVDMRARDWADYREGVAAMLALSGPGTVACAQDGETARVQVTQQNGYPPWPENPASLELADLFRLKARQLGLGVRAVRERAASDGSLLWERAPTLDGVGPVGAHIHCSVHDPAGGKFQESVVRSSFFDRALINLALIRHLAAR